MKLLGWSRSDIFLVQPGLTPYAAFGKRSFMLLYLAIKTMSPGSHQAATRPGGPFLVLTRHCRIMALGRNKPHQWGATYADLISDDWNVVDLDELRSAAEEEGEGEGR